MSQNLMSNQNLIKFQSLVRGWLVRRKYCSGLTSHRLNLIKDHNNFQPPKTQLDFYIENNSQQEESFESKQYDCIRKIMTDSDLPSIMGDYSFAVMPLLISNEMPSKEILETIINNLKMLLWKLEDALIQLPVSNKLMAQFLTQNLINSSEI